MLNRYLLNACYNIHKNKVTEKLNLAFNSNKKQVIKI